MGYAETLERLSHAMLAWTQPALAASVGITQPPRILLHGPPGVGKTHMLKFMVASVGKQRRTKVTWVAVSDIFSQYVGDSEKKLRDVFTGSAGLIVLDNLHLICAKRAHTESVYARLLATLLMSMDGIEGQRHAVIATSQLPPSALDEAAVRPGRFDHWVAVDPPDAETRALLADHYKVQELCLDFQRCSLTAGEIRAASSLAQSSG